MSDASIDGCSSRSPADTQTNRALAVTRSASASAAASAPIRPGRGRVSASSETTMSPAAASSPCWSAHGFPIQPAGGSAPATTRAPCSRATSAVPSEERSSTTITSATSGSSARPARHGPIRAASSRAGITTLTSSPVVVTAASGGRRDRPRANRAATAPPATTWARARSIPGGWQVGSASVRLNPDVHEGAALDLNDTQELAEYRATVRAWLEEHAAEAPNARGDDDAAVAARRAWQRRLAEGGLAAVTWPAEYGGAGLGPLQQVVVNQEIGRAGVPGIFDIIGVGMLGPTLIAHGNEDQKQRHLGPMLTADEVWCQLFSEPAAGSDLAGVQTRAKQQEDGSWRLSGQKVWT